MKKISSIISLLLCLLINPWLEAQPTPQDKSPVLEAPKPGEEDIFIDLQWSEVTGVTRYRVEVRSPEGKLMAEKETTETKARIALPPGEYEKRLGLINKFNKLYLWTDWNPLRIIRVLDPAVELAKPVDPIARGSGRQAVALKTKGVMPQTKYFLIDPDGNSKPANVIQNGDDFILDVNPDTMKPGDYDLVMENPEGKRDIERRIITIDRSPSEKAEWRRKNLSYAMLIPGIPQRDRGQKLKSNALMISFLGSLAFTAYSYQQASSAYSRLQSDPLYGLFSDSSATTALNSQLSGNQGLYLAALVGYGQWQADTTTYNRYRLYYYTGAALTAGLYAYHLVDVYRFEIGMTRSASGEPALRTGLTWNF